MKKVQQAERLQAREHAATLELFQGPDRSAVIVGVAYIDGLLTKALVARLGPQFVKAEEPDELFGIGRSAAAFGARIYFAYRCGIIDAEFVKALRLLEDIRNLFAHEPHGGDCSESPVKEKIHSLAKYFPKNRVVAMHQTKDNESKLIRAVISQIMNILLFSPTSIGRIPLGDSLNLKGARTTRSAEDGFYLI